MKKINIDNLETGYFATEAKPSFSTQTHLYDTKNKKALCGYQPAPSLIFQWCNRDAKSSLHLQCNGCKKKQKKL